MAVILAIPVSAAGGVSGQVYKMSDYYSDTILSVNDNPTNVYHFDDLIGSWFTFADGEYLHRTDAKKSTCYFGSSAEYDSLSFYYFPTGGVYQNSGFLNNYIYVGDVLPGSLISFEVTYNFSITYYDSPTGDVSILWNSIVSFYDADFNYLSRSVYEESVIRAGGGASGDSIDLCFSVSVPDDAVYIVPCQRVDLDPSGDLYGIDFSVATEATSSLSAFVEYTAIDPDSEHFEKIENKLDDLMSGSPEQNEAADNANDTLSGSREELDNLADQMDQLKKPDPSDLSSGLNSYVDPDSTSSLTEVLHNVSNSGIIITMMSIACTIVLSSYVLFGKRV